MLNAAACVPVKNDRFGCHFKGVVKVVKARRDVYSLNIRFSLACRVGQRTGPHAVKFLFYTVHLHTCILNNQAGETVVGLKNSDDFFSGNQSAEPFQSNFWSGSDFFQPFVHGS